MAPRRNEGSTVVFGYVDPGAGSLLIQAAIAALVAIPFLIRRQISRAVGVLRRGRAAHDS
jgi:hypothetical protein